jgi:flavin reductase (DIM6/NTAB) family NADH-FMN oxidoreductase RutF
MQHQHDQPKKPEASFVIDEHNDFKSIEAARPPFDHSLPITTTQTPSPSWKYGDGATDTTDTHFSHVEIDPYAHNLARMSNYKLLISGIPRPISFISTVSSTGESNLAPFSYFQVVDHDPPILVVGFSGRVNRMKDTRRNLLENGECAISVVSEHMIEAVNATSLELPSHIVEWDLSGFESAKSTTVKPRRVKDAVFSMEAKLLEMKNLNYGKPADMAEQEHGALAILQVTRFWVREDALDKDNDEVVLEKMRPLVQLGGISYGRINSTFELPRPRLERELQDKVKGLRKYIPQVDQKLSSS